MAGENEGRFLIPDHEMLRVIGRGAYGEIWMARSLTGALRAVKIVQRNDFESERAFQREFDGMSAFEPISRAHDGFVDILHVGRGTGFFYYIMELADDVTTGADIDIARYEPKTLRSELQRRKRIPARECLDLALSLTGALTALHAHELAHRDIKPANLIFVRGVPKLADIGLVASSGQKSFVGTEGYVPPEGPGTAQADIYSLGKVLYELSMGKDRMEFPEVPTRLDELADKDQLIGLNEILLKACAGTCGSRYKCAETMHRDLLRLQSGKKRALNRWIVAGGAILLAGGVFAASKVDWTGLGVPAKTAVDAPATLSVSTVPVGALVVLDDRLHNSPATFDQLSPGHHALHVMLKGYEPLDRQFELAAGATLALGNLALVPSHGSFQLISVPPGAEFSLKQGDKIIRRGKTPITLRDLPVGTYEFSATANRLTLEDSVEILRNETAARSLDFGPGSGTVKITSAPGGAAILQDGKEIGHTPWVIEDVPPGEVTYEVQLAGYKPARLEGGVQSGQRLFLAARLERSLAPVPGQPWTNSLGLRFVPVNDVRFCIWDTRVKDYAQFCTATGRQVQTPDFPQTPDDPVVLVNWQDAMDFCRWLTEKERAAGLLDEHLAYRLPTDLEWSTAAGMPGEGGATPESRDGKIRGLFPWGKTWPPSARSGNYADQSLAKKGEPVISGYVDGFAQTSPVGSFAANALGLYDVGGNVWEWCLEGYKGGNDARDWGVLRGGSWATSKRSEAESGYRNVVDRGDRDVIYGFRCVLAPDEQP